ncbi:unnamed protein product [Prorocentrum cordatum]|nr:unnamed protein product [Polarella glacialis]
MLPGESSGERPTGAAVGSTRQPLCAAPQEVRRRAAFRSPSAATRGGWCGDSSSRGPHRPSAAPGSSREGSNRTTRLLDGLGVRLHPVMCVIVFCSSVCGEHGIVRHID